MNKVDQLVRACSELKLQIIVGPKITLDSGASIEALALINHLGAEHGMIVVTEWNKVAAVYKELQSAGYGFCVLNAETADPFDICNFIVMFRDWGWAGLPEKAPAWITGV